MPFGKLPARYNTLIMPLILSLLMTCVVSAISVLRTQGASSDALALWPSAWVLSWCVAFPVLLVILPMVRRIAAFLVESR